MRMAQPCQLRLIDGHILSAARAYKRLASMNCSVKFAKFLTGLAHVF